MQISKYMPLILLSSIPVSLSFAAQPPTKIRITRDQQHAVALGSALLCPGGQEDPLQVVLFPDAVVSDGKTESIEYHAESFIALREEGAVAWTAILIDDSGEVIAPLSVSRSFVEPGASVVSEPLIPGPLKDGFYAIRVTATLVTKTGEYSAETTQPFAVSSGQVKELSVDDWADSTNAYAAVERDVPLSALQFPKRDVIPPDQQQPPLGPRDASTP